MTATLAARKSALESMLSKVCGFKVEITFRGDMAYTLSAEGNRDFCKAANFFREQNKYTVTVSVSYDEECNDTCCYIELA